MAIDPLKAIGSPWSRGPRDDSEAALNSKTWVGSVKDARKRRDLRELGACLATLEEALSDAVVAHSGAAPPEELPHHALHLATPYLVEERLLTDPELSHGGGWLFQTRPKGDVRHGAACDDSAQWDRPITSRPTYRQRPGGLVLLDQYACDGRVQG